MSTLWFRKRDLAYLTFFAIHLPVMFRTYIINFVFVHATTNDQSLLYLLSWLRCPGLLILTFGFADHPRMCTRDNDYGLTQVEDSGSANVPIMGGAQGLH